MYEHGSWFRLFVKFSGVQNRYLDIDTIEFEKGVNKKVQSWMEERKMILIGESKIIRSKTKGEL